jgi:hypothetical protein
VAAGAIVLVLIAVLPALLSFALAVALAVGWTRWLDRHPDGTAQ